MINQDPALVNSRLDDDTTPLLSATYAGQLEVVKYLLSQGAVINTRDNVYHYTPLHAAVHIRNHEIAKYLISSGADINAKTISKETPLHLAIPSGDVAFVEYLVSEGADLTAKDNYEQIPVVIAEAYGYTEIATILRSPRKIAKKSKTKKIVAKKKVSSKLSPQQPAEPAPINYRPDRLILPEGVTVKPYPKDWGLIIGIEDYQRLPEVEYARKDALLVREYFTRVLGVPEENIISLVDSEATKASIEGYLKQYIPINVGKDTTLYVYFAGHGLPGTRWGEPYLVP
jgi:hypothetical protein